MSSWLREIPRTQNGVKTPQEMSTPVTEAEASYERAPISLEVRQYPNPIRQRQPREAPVEYVEPPTQPLEVKQFPTPPARGRPVEKQVAPTNSIEVAPLPRRRPVEQTNSTEVKQFPTPPKRNQATTTNAKVQPVQQQPALPPMKTISRPSNPSVTVLIPLYNGFEFLEGSLESVRRQTYKNWVGIVGVNGHGKTGEPVVSRVKALLTQLGLQEAFTVINLPDIKGGAAAITEMAQNHATSTYVAHLDCDDIWLPKKLDIQMKEMEDNPEVGISGTMCRYFGDSSDIPVLPAGNLMKSDFVKKNPLIHSSIVIRRELATYTDEFVAYDYECWIRHMLDDVKIINIDTILLFHRIHMKSFYNASGKQDPEAVREKYKLA